MGRDGVREVGAHTVQGLVACADFPHAGGPTAGGRVVWTMFLASVNLML